jgi:hypothetical protein
VSCQSSLHLDSRQLFASLVAERADEFPPLRACEPVAAQHLPAQVTSFVGREAEMSDVRQILAAVQSILR